MERFLGFFLKHKLVVFVVVLGILYGGFVVAPFDWSFMGIGRDPVPVDAIPDIGENQQIVFTKWMGRSPQDVEDQVTYPLTVSLLGVPGVKTVRSYSMFGFSSIYVIFKEDVDFYWSRSRILEKLNSLPAGTLPGGVQPALGPDATALGQIFWYTIEGRDENGKPSGGWDLHELRTVQDWYVRYALLSADGISEVASIGGHVKEYQIDVDPDAMRAYNVTLTDVFNAVKMSNLDVGARTVEINRVEYVIRGVGFVKEIKDLEETVVTVSDNVPVYIKTIGKVSLGPALRRGALDKDGTEVVGGVAVVRYGGNPLQAIKNLKEKIKQISPGLPKKNLRDGRVSQLTIVPFYDRTGLIDETLGTLNTALTGEILVTIIVVIILLLNLRSSLLISSMLPLAVLMTFIAMKLFSVDANIVALSGIAIAIGTIVDMGIIVVENILKHLRRAAPDEDRMKVVIRGAAEVGSAVITAVATTVVSFLPVFTMIAQEGKLFRPLAFTKTFALIASIFIALLVLPAFVHLLFGKKIKSNNVKRAVSIFLIVVGIASIFFLVWWIGVIVILVGAWHVLQEKIPGKHRALARKIINYAAVVFIGFILAKHWLPLGPEKGIFINLLFVGAIIGGILLFFYLFERVYPRVLRFLLAHKGAFLSFVLVFVLCAVMIWLGLGREFMPPLDEGAYLYMPTTMPHASIGEVLDVMKKQDMGFAAIPEIDSAVGKLGRAETPLDPAPVSMIETVINYKPQYKTDASGRRLRFRYEPGEEDFFRDEHGNPLPAADGEPYKVEGKYIRGENGKLIPDSGGYPFRFWRPALDPDINPGRKAWAGIQSPEDIWNQILHAGKIPGTTSAPVLQPISARIVMLQSGMRAPMGIKIYGPNLETIEKFGLELEKHVKEVDSVEQSAVIADRIIGKPYLEIEIDRRAIARYGIHVRDVQQVIEVAVGGKPVTTTVEGRERYPVRVRYLRERRNSIEALNKIIVPTRGGAQIPLGQLATIKYVRGPQMIKSENTFLVGYLLFDKKPGYAEIDVVEDVKKHLDKLKADGKLAIPGGVNYEFAGNYVNQRRFIQTLMMILPVALVIIFLILYFQFKKISVSLMVFSGIAVAWAGGFILIWLYGQGWFMDFSVFGTSMRDLFQVGPINMSVAVWVGFLALFGIASDDGVLIATYLEQTFDKRSPKTIAEIREAVVEAGKRRIKPALMTTATTILALLPVLTSTGRGSDIMVPMAIPTFGGMVFALITLFVVPVCYCGAKELSTKWKKP